MRGPRRSPCDRAWQIDAIRDGTLGESDTASFERHAATCDDCRRRERDDALLRRLTAELDRPPDELAIRRVRARVLRAAAVGAPAPPRTRRAAGVAIAAVACAGLAAIGVARARRPSAEAPRLDASVAPFAATIEARDGATWLQIRRGGVETVRLDDGSLTIHVRKQRPDERFVVTLPDGELEVRGTTFEVDVSGRATARVRVREGIVAARIDGGAEDLLGAGDEWPRIDAPRVDVDDLPRARKERPSARPPPPDGGDDGAAAQRYGAAVAAYRGGELARAAALFRDFAARYPGDALVEDATFLEASALGRSGDWPSAITAARLHLARFPRSFHGREAAALIARGVRADRSPGAVERCRAASAAIAPWASDPEIRAAIDACPPAP